VEGFRLDRKSEIAVPLQRAVQLARVLQRRATELQTPRERRQQDELARMIAHPHDKATLV